MLKADRKSCQPSPIQKLSAFQPELNFSTLPQTLCPPSAISFAEVNSENKTAPFLSGMSEKPKPDRFSFFNNCGITQFWIAFRAWGFCCDPHTWNCLQGEMTPVFVTCCGASRVHCKLLQELSSPARCFCSSLHFLGHITSKGPLLLSSLPSPTVE